MAAEKDPTTERLLREGDELLDSSHELLRDLDDQLRAGTPTEQPPS